MDPAISRFHAFLLTEKCVSSNTFSAYKTDLDQFSGYLAGRKLMLRDATTSIIRDYLRHLKKRNVSARSTARKISSLRTFFSYTHDHMGWEDVMHNIITPKIEKKLPNYLSEQEVEALLKVSSADDTATGMRNKVMLFLLYVSGMRISELTHLVISDIRFDTGFVEVKGKGGKERLVPLPQYMLGLLREYINTAHRAFVNSEQGHRPTEFLFPTFYAGKVKPISRQLFWGTLKELWSKTGSKRTISPHQLRHSLATHMLKSGANLRSLQLILGHENLSTVQIYTHVEKSHLRAIYDKKHPRSR